MASFTPWILGLKPCHWDSVSLVFLALVFPVVFVTLRVSLYGGINAWNCSRPVFYLLSNSGVRRVPGSPWFQQKSKAPGSFLGHMPTLGPTSTTLIGQA